MALFRIMKKKSSFKSIGSVIEEIIGHIKPPADLWLDDVKDNWKKIVGPEVAKNTKVERIEESVLLVHVSSHIWKNELRGGLGIIILKRIQNEITDKIKKIRWQ